jgi:hypothetical protein
MLALSSSQIDQKRTQCLCATLVLRGVSVAGAQRCALQYLLDGAIRIPEFQLTTETLSFALPLGP